MSELLETRAAEVTRRGGGHPRADTSPPKTERPNSVVVRAQFNNIILLLYLYIRSCVARVCVCNII